MLEKFYMTAYCWGFFPWGGGI